jgi:hypothetical protein
MRFISQHFSRVRSAATARLETAATTRVAAAFLRANICTATKPRFPATALKAAARIFLGSSNQYDTLRSATSRSQATTPTARGRHICRPQRPARQQHDHRNSAVFDFGAGLYLGAGDAELHSTIVANNSTGGGLNAADIAGHAGAAITGAHNLIIASTIAVPGDTISADPKLARSPTMTAACSRMPCRPAVRQSTRARTHATWVSDERGLACPPVGQCSVAERTVGPATDIGAFEFGAFDHVFDNGFDPEA